MVIVARVRFVGPLEPYAQGFADELLRQGYSPNTGMKNQLFFVSHLSRWLADQAREVSALACPDVVEAFLAERRRLGYASRRTGVALVPLFEHLQQLGVVARAPAVELSSTEALLERYRRYLIDERGLATTTARSYSDTVRPFVAGRELADEVELAGLTAADVAGFVVEACAGQTRSSAKRTVTALRSLLGFLHVEGILQKSLVAAVPSAASWRLAGLPRGLKPDEVQRLLAAPDRRRGIGRRDFAVLMLLIRLGLRAGEVAALTLDDIDWRAGDLMVRGKGDRRERLPLPDDVGQALVGYLQRGRPATALTRHVHPSPCPARSHDHRRGLPRGVRRGPACRPRDGSSPSAATLCRDTAAGSRSVSDRDRSAAASPLAADHGDLCEGRHRGAAFSRPALARG